MDVDDERQGIITARGQVEVQLLALVAIRHIREVPTHYGALGVGQVLKFHDCSLRIVLMMASLLPSALPR